MSMDVGRNQSSSRAYENTEVGTEVHHRRNDSMHHSDGLGISARFRNDPEATPVRNQFNIKPQPVTWMSLPRKDQLAILFFSRLVDFLQVASLQAYMFYQLKSFDPGLSDAAISSQAGILQGCFTGAQVATAMLWGKAADSSLGGRKMVLLIGLAGTAVSCIGYGFSTTFWQAAMFRVLGGGINGTVGIIRTMIAEITKEKKYQSRAFLLLPMSFNVAGILGPVMGGLLADPTSTLPGLFGENAIFGARWLRAYPYALPSILNALTLTISAALVFFFLEETLKERKGKYDLGLDLAQRMLGAIPFRSQNRGYELVDEHTPTQLEQNTEDPFKPKAGTTTRRITHKLPFHRIWTRNVIFTLITTAFFDFHVGGFTNIWSLFLSTPRPLPEETVTSLPFIFSGGLAMPAATVGLATSILGILGMILQIFLYPPVQARLGTLGSFRVFCMLFPIAYMFAPYLAVLPSSTAPPNPAAGGFIWTGITLVLLLQVAARTFALPATIILINNCSPHPSVLGTVHGLGQSVSASFRTIGPIVGGIWYGEGLKSGAVGAAWWGIAAAAAAGSVTALWVYEGSGHEIFLEGELEEGDEMEMAGVHGAK
ncbi:MFS transporter-like protein [Coleophoma cylindrospora]|uniref:MFS transporter-like protein n=1 Tax=Coleophoma cylindrospora TaxID=1849047 RepID=A0A3D8S0L7_9HELO|nr:MFS transporter-like protein [Coleophoma cylindrospora]